MALTKAGRRLVERRKRHQKAQVQPLPELYQDPETGHWSIGTGHYIEAVRSALAKAIEINAPVTLNFNDVIITFHPGENHVSAGIRFGIKWEQQFPADATRLVRQ